MFEGTCYCAAGWLPVGLTKGFARHAADFYRFHNRPKKLWLHALGGLTPEQARNILCGPLPEVCKPGATSSAAGLFEAPSYNVYYNLLSQISLDAFAKELTAWLQAGRGKLPSSLALDGKMSGPWRKPPALAWVAGSRHARIIR